MPEEAAQPKQNQNSDTDQDFGNDPEIEMMDRVADDVEQRLGGDIKRILRDRKEMARQGKHLKKVDIEFDVDTKTVKPSSGSWSKSSTGAAGGGKSMGGQVQASGGGKQHNAQSHALRKQAKELQKKAEDLQKKSRDLKEKADKMRNDRRNANMSAEEARRKDTERFGENGYKPNQRDQANAQGQKEQEMQETGENSDQWNQRNEQEEQKLRDEAEKLKQEAKDTQKDAANKFDESRAAMDDIDNPQAGYREYDNLDKMKFDENGNPKESGTSTPHGAATGDSPLDPTKAGRGGAATGADSTNLGSAQMGTESNMNSDNNGAYDREKSGDDFANAIQASANRARPGSVRETEKQRLLREKGNPTIQDTEKEQLLKRQLNKSKKYDPGSDVKPGAGDLAKSMGGGAGAPTGGKGGGFQTGGGQIDPSQFDAQKQAGAGGAGKGGKLQQAGNAMRGAMDQGKQAADSVKRQLAAAKQMGKNVKDKITAPVRKVQEAKEKLSNLVESFNPIKKIKEMMQQVWKMIPIAMRMLIEYAGYKMVLIWADRLLKPDNVDKILTCMFCCNCIQQFLMFTWPIWLVAIIIAGVAAS